MSEERFYKNRMVDGWPIVDRENGKEGLSKENTIDMLNGQSAAIQELTKQLEQSQASNAELISDANVLEYDTAILREALSNSNEMLYELVKVWAIKMPNSAKDAGDQFKRNKQLIDGASQQSLNHIKAQGVRELLETDLNQKDIFLGYEYYESDVIEEFAKELESNE